MVKKAAGEKVELANTVYPNVYDGVDWHWGRSMLGAIRFLPRHRMASR